MAAPGSAAAALDAALEAIDAPQYFDLAAASRLAVEDTTADRWFAAQLAAADTDIPPASPRRYFLPPPLYAYNKCPFYLGIADGAWKDAAWALDRGHFDAAMNQVAGAPAQPLLQQRRPSTAQPRGAAP
eukprot:SM010287S09151  [mRNA]  locus=s10287:46:522:+ [translate_table: standard]